MLNIKKKKTSPSTVIIAVVALLTVLSLTLAMFLSEVSVGRTFDLSNFKVTSSVKFSSVAATPTNGVYAVDYRNSAAANYIENMEIGVNFYGYGVAFVRIKVVEEWSRTVGGVKTVLPYTADMPYTYANQYAQGDTGNQKKWFNNRSNDGYFYYAAPIYSAENSESTAVSLPLITGFDVDAIDIGAISSDTVLNIAVEVEAVQVNRYPQFWGLSRLPWTNASSAVPEGISNA